MYIDPDMHLSLQQEEDSDTELPSALLMNLSNSHVELQGFKYDRFRCRIPLFYNKTGLVEVSLWYLPHPRNVYQIRLVIRPYFEGHLGVGSAYHKVYNIPRRTMSEFKDLYDVLRDWVGHSAMCHRFGINYLTRVVSDTFEPVGKVPSACVFDAYNELISEQLRGNEMLVFGHITRILLKNYGHYLSYFYAQRYEGVLNDY